MRARARLGEPLPREVPAPKRAALQSGGGGVARPAAASGHPTGMANHSRTGPVLCPTGETFRVRVLFNRALILALNPVRPVEPQCGTN